MKPEIRWLGETHGGLLASLVLDPGLLPTLDQVSGAFVQINLEEKS